MERLCNLFFELSNEDRLNILLKLMEKPMKLTHLAKALEITAQECSRQLSRLMDIDLVTKDPDGAFVLQPYGLHAFRLFPGFQFLTEHVEYFNRHTLTKLPEKFMNRIGELKGCEPVIGLMGTIARVERIVLEAEEYWWYISPEPLATASSIGKALEVIEGGINARGIEPLTYRRPAEIERDISKEMRENIRKLRVSGGLDNKYMENIDVSIYMSEKEVALLAFPEITGQFDYQGFTSTDPKVHEWCKELHEHYFDRAVPWQEHVGYDKA
jgi:predicted transcriptional regulator